MPDPLQRAAAALSLADRALDIADGFASLVGRVTPEQRAARLRARAIRLRARADALDERPFEWSRRDRLRARAAGLDIRADAIAPRTLPPA